MPQPVPLYATLRGHIAAVSTNGLFVICTITSYNTNMGSHAEQQAIANAIKETYGDHNLTIFNELAALYPDTPPQEIADRVRANPTPTTTCFFRDPNLAVFATETAPKIAQAAGSRTLRIAEVACSTGEETWSLAAMLDASGIKDFSITAVDVNPLALDKARQGVYSHDALEGGIPLPIEQKAVKSFNRDRQHGTVEPTAALRSRVTFANHDILTGSIPDGPYDAVVVNNMLYHYPEQARNRIIANITGSLVAGGIMVFDNDIDATRGSYPAWSADLKNTNGLGPYTGTDRHNGEILQYNPDLPRRAAAMSAAGIARLAAPNGGNKLERVGQQIALAVEMVSEERLETVISAMGEFIQLLAVVGEDSPRLEKLSRQLHACTILVQSASANLAIGSYNLRAYLAEVGLRAPNESNNS